MNTEHIIEATRTICNRTSTAPFSWHGRQYKGTPSAYRTQSTFTTMGKSAEFTGSLLCDISQFPNDIYPASRDTITLNNKTRRIISAEPDPLGACVRLDLGEQY